MGQRQPAPTGAEAPKDGTFSAPASGWLQPDKREVDGSLRSPSAMLALLRTQIHPGPFKGIIRSRLGIHPLGRPSFWAALASYCRSILSVGLRVVGDDSKSSSYHQSLTHRLLVGTLVALEDSVWALPATESAEVLERDLL